MVDVQSDTNLIIRNLTYKDSVGQLASIDDSTITIDHSLF